MPTTRLSRVAASLVAGRVGVSVECPERADGHGESKGVRRHRSRISDRCPRSPSRCPTARAVACPPGPRPATSRHEISPRLAKAALAAVVDDRLVDLTRPLEQRRRGPHRHRREPRGAAALPAQHGAPAGGGRHEALSRRAVRHRAGDRRGLLLRLRRRSAVRAGGSRGDREEDEGARGAGSALRAADVAARRGEAVLRAEGRAAQGPADRREDRRDSPRSPATRSRTATRSSTSASGRTCRRPAG